MLAIGAASIFGLMLAAPTCSAKVADCSSITSSGVEYSSHGNHVQAIRKSTGKVLWKTVLFTERYTKEFDPKLEEDVQWNIACIRKVLATEVVVSDTRERVFRVRKADGSLIGGRSQPGVSRILCKRGLN